jgi:hypothetical protein
VRTPETKSYQNVFTSNCIQAHIEGEKIRGPAPFINCTGYQSLQCSRLNALNVQELTATPRSRPTSIRMDTPNLPYVLKKLHRLVLHFRQFTDLSQCSYQASSRLQPLPASYPRIPLSILARQNALHSVATSQSSSTSSTLKMPTSTLTPASSMLGRIAYVSLSHDLPLTSISQLWNDSLGIYDPYTQKHEVVEFDGISHDPAFHMVNKA